MSTRRDSITPGAVWYDTSGHRIQAHGGSIFTDHDGTFYWYGENKERTTPDGAIWHWGIRAYSSTDLTNWDDRGLIIPPTPDNPDSPLHPAKWVDRPHIIFNQRTRKYVCWIKIMRPDTDTQETTILTADTFLGPYTIIHTGLLPLGMSAGDFDLTVDPDTGRGYYYFDKPHTEIICADLTDDYTDVTGEYSSHFPRPGAPEGREAPAYFRRGDTHYLITSGTTWYYPNRSEIASAPAHHGPWTVIGDPHPADTAGTSFRSQISSVFQHPEKKDLYIAIADRWIADNTVAVAEQATPEIGDTPIYTAVADYVWLPIRFNGETPVIAWLDEWRVDDFD